MECLHCGKKISALRKLQDEEFCSAAHRKAYKKKQEDLAVDFLRQSKPRRVRPEAPQPEPKPVTAVKPQPVPVLAEFRPAIVAHSCLKHAPRRNAEWTLFSSQVILPASSGLTAPSIRGRAFIAVSIRPGASAEQIRAVPGTAVAFGGNDLMLQATAFHPIWIEPVKRARVDRPAANFTSIQPVWARAGEHPAVAAVAVRFSAVPVLCANDIALRPVTLELAPARPMAIIASTGSDSAQEGFAHSWQSHGRVTSIPAAAVAPGVPCIASARPLTVPKPSIRTQAAVPVTRRAWRVSSEIPHNPCAVSTPRILGFTPSGRMRAVMPGARKIGVSTAIELQRSWRVPSTVLHQTEVALVCAARGFTSCQPMAMAAPHARDHAAIPACAIARHSIEPAPESPLIGSWRFALASPALRSGSPLSTKRLLHKLVPIPVTKVALSVVWKVEVRLGRDARVIPLRPRFEEPLIVAPKRVVQPELPVDPWTRLSAFWFAAPRWSRHLAALLILAVVALAGFRHLKASGSIQKANHEVIARLRERAAIDIQDDFRSGLSQWTGPPGWANSWTYDATGFARPGRLALLAGSAPLSDYRLEFLAEIDKKAVAWVFRAVDGRNYYAYKLTESKHETGAVFSIVRYAMVGGHERMRIQLPLPVTTTAKSMFRIRQEIRGDQFTTYLDGRVIDTWSDAALARGGFGFFADPGEAAYIRWVDVAYQDDTLGRICAYLVPAKHD